MPLVLHRRGIEDMELLEGILSRQSIRNYLDQPVLKDQLLEIIKAGTYAPSGLNNQPWRFVIIQDQDVRCQLATMTKYSQIIETAPACIAVFLDRNSTYHEIKDYQAIGACLQNMLLAAYALGLGAVWLGEIMKNADKVLLLFELPQEMEFMAVIAIGYPDLKICHQPPSRQGIQEVLLKEY